MRHSRILGFLLCTAGALGPLAAGAQTPPDPAGTGAVAGADTEELVVDFNDGASAASMGAVARDLHLTLVPNSVMAPEDHVFRAVVPRAEAPGVLARLRAESAVEAADENAEMHADFTPNDPMLPQQWGMRRVGAPAAWDITCGRGVTVAVVDTGVACENHGEFTRLPDLAGTRCLPGWNFVRNNAHANDDQGHGTHVAGTIAQTTNNRLGTAGVAYCATILPVKVLDGSGRGTLANVAEGIRWAADHGAQVINLSLGGGGRSRVMAKAVEYARAHGATVICAAGNNGRYVESPANEPGSVAVSAIDSGDQIAFFSSRGPEIAVAAPGVGILQQTICDHGRNRCEQYASWSGTSMAAPHAAGVAALLVSMGVTDPSAVEAALRATASRPAHGGTARELYGAGIVSGANAAETVLWHHGIVRLLALALAASLVAWRIRRKHGELSWGWVLPSIVTGVGAFGLPALVSRAVVPGLDLAMRPLVEWDAVLLGANVHKWLPFAHAGIAMALVGLGFGRRALRSPIGGVALGIAGYLLAAAYLGDAYAPFGGLLFKVWTLANAAVCLWVARIGIDRKAE